MSDETTISATPPAPPPEVDIAAALHAAQQHAFDLEAQVVILADQRDALQSQLTAVQEQLANATQTLTPADRLAEAYRLVDQDKVAKKAAYDAEQAEAQAKHQAELDFIKSCTPQQVQQAGLVIGPLTTHAMVYERLRAVVGNG